MGEWISIPQTCVTLNNRQKKVKRLLDSGLPCGKIARMLHVAYDVVLDDVYIIHSAEFRNGGEKMEEIKKNRIRWTEEAEADLCAAYASGDPVANIAARLGHTPGATYKKIKELKERGLLESRYMSKGTPGNTPNADYTVPDVSITQESHTVSDVSRVPDTVLDAVREKINEIESDLVFIQQDLKRLEGKKKELSDWLEGVEV